MDLYTSLRKATALDRLAELEEQDAVLFAARAQALVDVEDLCRAQPEADRAMSFVALDIATACDVAQSTATARLTRAKHLVHDLPQTHQLLRRRLLRVGQGWRSWRRPKACLARPAMPWRPGRCRRCWA